MTSEERKQHAREMVRACGEGDVAAIAALTTDDFRYEMMDRDASWSIEGQSMQEGMDRKTFLEIGVPSSADLFEDGLHFSVEAAVSEGPYVALFGTSNARVRNGKTYSNFYCWFFRFAGDKIDLYREYCDTQLSRDVLFG